MLVEITLYWTFIIVDKVNSKTHENQYSTNIDEITV